MTRRPLHGGRYLPQPCKCGSGKPAEWVAFDGRGKICADCAGKNEDALWNMPMDDLRRLCIEQAEKKGRKP